MIYLAKLAKRLSQTGARVRRRYRLAWAHVFFVVQFSNPAFAEFQIAIATIGLAILGGDLVPFLFGLFHLAVWSSGDPPWRARAASSSTLLYSINAITAGAGGQLSSAWAFGLVALSMLWAYARLSRRLG